MLLVIDVGNTNTSLGVFRGAELVAHWRLTTNAAGVKERVAARIVLRPYVTERENASSFDEERSPLREESLERRQIHHCRIDFDLTEVRIECRIESQIRGETDLCIEPCARLYLVPVDEWIVARHGWIGCLCQYIRNQLDLLYRAKIPEPSQVSVAIDSL